MTTKTSRPLSLGRTLKVSLELEWSFAVRWQYEAGEDATRILLVFLEGRFSEHFYDV